MGGCCCSSRKPHLHGTPVYYYCPPGFEEHDSLTSQSGAVLLAELNLNRSTPDTFRPPPAPLPYDAVLGCSESSDSESVDGGILDTSATCESIEDPDCKTSANSLPASPKKPEISKVEEILSATEEEDACPICLEEYDTENPEFLTKCDHHFHLSCILEWMERSDTCPICDQEMVFGNDFN
ncbi:RING/U-box superfamily protein [Euphorbia peplus]|nr:RING/U-box superfamily protein [Euphorbia peplus]